MKLRQGFKLYAIVTQFLLQTFALVVLGIYIGSKFDAKYDTGTMWSGILGIVGTIVGLTYFAIYVYKLGKNNGKR